MADNIVAENIRKLRNERRWTQPQLADKLGVSTQTISNWETGLKVPRMGSLQKLAEIFNVSKSDLLEDKPHINSAAYTIAAHIDDDTPEAEREQIINFIENLKKARNNDKV